MPLRLHDATVLRAVEISELLTHVALVDVANA